MEAAEGGKAPGPYTARALSDAETALTSIAAHIGAVQPPTSHSGRQICASLDPEIGLGENKPSDGGSE